MKASSWLPSILHVTPGENLDPLDQAVAAISCRSLREGAVLEFIIRRTRHRLLLGWRGFSLAPLYLALGVCGVVLGVVSSCLLVVGCMVVSLFIKRGESLFWREQF